jgi:hypothetical protein
MGRATVIEPVTDHHPDDDQSQPHNSGKDGDHDALRSGSISWSR